MRIDHIGYAVRNIEKAKIILEEIGFSFEEVIDDPDRNILIQFGKKDGYCIELVCPKDIGESPVDFYINKVGSTPYHICYCSGEIEKDIEELKKKKCKVIIPLTPAIAFAGRRVVFMMHREIGIFEIVEEI